MDERRAAEGEAPTQAADFVLEVGCEELPVADVDAAAAALGAGVPELLGRLRLDHGPVTVWATPRRLAVHVADLAPRQRDLEEEVVGPPAQVAFDATGAPTKAAEGFAKGMGVAATELVVVERSGESRVAALRREDGRPAAQALAEALPELVAGIAFPRSMRWNASGAAFSRPVRWLVALHGRAVVPMSFAGLHAGSVSRGLRPAGSPPVPIASAADYAATMASQGIVLKGAERRARVRAQADALAAEHAAPDGPRLGARIPADEALVAEVANLVEQPRAILGHFDPASLELPAEVLVTVMKKHQRYFPVVDASGALLPHFVAVANGADVDEDVVRQGNEAVVRARFADAAYFWHQDRKRRLEEFTPDLERLAFETRLGSMRAKVERLVRLGPGVADLLGLSAEDRRATARAAALAKSDLASSLVVEMTSLQGVVGREYALLDGEDARVATALAEQYLPRSAGGALPASAPGTALALADRLDSLVGLFAVGHRTSGTQDPYGLRRSALGIVAILCARDLDLDLAAAVDLAAAELPVALDAAARTDVLAFLARRLEGQLRDDGHAADAVAAVRAVQSAHPAAASRAVGVLEDAASAPDWEATLTAYARCARIVRSAEGVADAIDPALFVEEAEGRLHTALQAATEGLDRGNPAAVLAALRGLAAPINAFFDGVMVMADSITLRANRLALVGQVATLPAEMADLSQMEGF